MIGEVRWGNLGRRVSVGLVSGVGDELGKRFTRATPNVLDACGVIGLEIIIESPGDVEKDKIVWWR